MTTTAQTPVHRCPSPTQGTAGAHRQHVSIHPCGWAKLSLAQAACKPLWHSEKLWNANRPVNFTLWKPERLPSTAARTTRKDSSTPHLGNVVADIIHDVHVQIVWGGFEHLGHGLAHQEGHGRPEKTPELSGHHQFKLLPQLEVSECGGWERTRCPGSCMTYSLLLLAQCSAVSTAPV